MQRHITRTFASPTLSVEEEAIVADEVNQQVIDIDNTAQEADRIGDIVVSMNDIETVVSTTPQIGQTEEALISAAADMAIAGTDADPEEVVQDMLPASTDAEGNALSAEAFGDNVKSTLLKIWETIKAAISKMWEHVKAFYKSIREYFVGTKRRIEKLEKLLADNNQAKNVTLDKEAIFRGSSRWLLLDGEPVNVSRAMHDNVVSCGAILGFSAQGGEHLLDKVAEIGGKMVTTGTGSPTYLGLVDELRKYILEAQKAFKGVGFSNDKGEFVSDDKLLGGIKIVGRIPVKDQADPFGDSYKHGDNNFSGQFDNVNQYNLDVECDPKGKADIKLTSKVNEIEAVLDHSKTWVQMVEAKQGAMQSLSAKADGARAKIDSALKSLKTADQAQQKDIKALLAVVNRINAVVVKMSSKMVSYNTNVVNAALDYAIQSLEAVQGSESSSPKTPVAT